MARPPPDVRYQRPANARPARMVSRGPAIRRVGLRDHPARDLYHLALTISWPLFLAVFAGLYLAINVVFAGLYLLDPGAIANARPGAFSDAFFFSVQTIATIGYGGMVPAGLYANLLVTVETLFGLTLLALTTGLMFARFSRPTARVLFSRVLVVAPRDGQPTLMLRMANQRRNQILQAQVSLSLLRDEVTAEGEVMRRFHDLALSRAASPVFALTFTVMHPITPSSPLYGASAASLASEAAEFVVSVTGIDETMSLTVHARHSWGAEDIRWGHRFADILGWLDDGSRAIDFSRFHDTESTAGKGETMVDATKDKALALAAELRRAGRADPAERIEAAAHHSPLAGAALHALRAACELALTTLEALDPKTQLLAEELRLEIEKRLA